MDIAGARAQLPWRDLREQSIWLAAANVDWHLDEEENVCVLAKTLNACFWAQDSGVGY